ncbi:TetR/AcrR family transcriptional regulator [Thermomonospora catenispora]|uniref:TetR/AcrR family transcriptional regulator n=1 Tax=Thermomonospora catenispora TaxID=2493090 RepID=UPI0011205452|nr:TetR/AcrR family transcriptional regulator [Thermomonospora catenispora]TNY37575.1 TetR/AcrR family transcriptional regulator [Thermomonospora catenispora]
MPRNRRLQDREEKREEILAVAQRLFIDDGYESTSMGRIAEHAGVTVNTIYWYFRDKDDLLIAVLDRLLAEALAQYATITDRPLNERLLWAVDRLERLHGLVNTVHTRASVSPAVHTWHTGFHELADSLIADALRNAGAAEADIPAMTAIGTFVIEGLLTHRYDDADKRAVIDLLVHKLTTVPTQA